MSETGAMYTVGCAAEHVQQDGTCTVPVWVPVYQPVLPPLSLADGTIVSFAIVGTWAIGLVARLVFRAARMGAY